MSTTLQWQTLKERAAGKWQFPVLLLSLALLAGSFLRLRPSPTRLPFDKAVSHLKNLVSAGWTDRAIAFASPLLSRKDFGESERASVHLWLGRARYQAARHEGSRLGEFGKQIVEDYRYAGSYTLPLTSADFSRIGWALEWQGKYKEAVGAFTQSLEHGAVKPLALRKHIIELTLDELDPSTERAAAQLDRFLKDVADRRLDLRLWAIERRLQLDEKSGTLDQAVTLLTRNRDLFESSDLRHRFHYLEAWLLVKTGHPDEAETHLRTIRNQVERDDSVYAMTGWLLGRVVMGEANPQRPQEALSFFSDVIKYQPDSLYAVASRVGSAEALAMLERHDEALNAYRIAIEEWKPFAAHSRNAVVNLDVLRTSLAVRAESQRQEGHLRQAVDYAQLAVSILDKRDVDHSILLLQQLAQLQYLRAEALEDQATGIRHTADEVVGASSPQAAAAFAASASTYQKLLQLHALNERRAAETGWQVAELYTRAGQTKRAIELYRAFAKEHPQHPLTARALLRIGQLRQASGQWPQAVKAYQECYRRFPRLLDSARGLVPMARCYLAMGPEYEELAEKTVRVVLEDSEVFTPQAPEFADAMMLLGEALNRRGDYEKSIATLEEALDRYPDDPRILRARFLLADSYRQSGLALKAEVADAKFAEEMKRMRDDAMRRFESAQQLYHGLIAAYELRDPTTLTPIEKVHLRHSHLYEADCFFEMHDYRQALKLYEQSASLYKNTPSALSAYVQIINSHVFLGEPEEARAALARALVLVDTIPEQAFKRSVDPEGRKDWKRYFDWLGESELF